MAKTKITMPCIIVQDCPEVIVSEDWSAECLDIKIGDVTINVFAEDGIPVIRYVRQQKEEPK